MQASQMERRVQTSYAAMTEGWGAAGGSPHGGVGGPEANGHGGRMIYPISPPYHRTHLYTIIVLPLFPHHIFLFCTLQVGTSLFCPADLEHQGATRGGGGGGGVGRGGWPQTRK